MDKYQKAGIQDRTDPVADPPCRWTNLIRLVGRPIMAAAAYPGALLLAMLSSVAKSFKLVDPLGDRIRTTLVNHQFRSLPVSARVKTNLEFRHLREILFLRFRENLESPLPRRLRE
jgi:hypothetical protein